MFQLLPRRQTQCREASRHRQSGNLVWYVFEGQNVSTKLQVVKPTRSDTSKEYNQATRVMSDFDRVLKMSQTDQAVSGVT